MKRLSVSLRLLAVLLAVLFLVSYSGQALASKSKKTYKIVCQSVWPPTHAMQKQGIEPYCKKIEKASNGRIKIDMFTKGQLVPTKEAMSALENRTFDMMAGYPTYWSGKIAIYDAIGAMPANFQDRLAFCDFWQNTEARDILDSSFRKLCHATILKPISSSPMYVYSKVPIRNFEEFKNVKIRCAGGAFIGVVKAIGGKPVANVAGPDTYIGLQKGTMDAAIFPIHGIKVYQLPEVTDYLIGPPLSNPVCMGFILMNVDAWNELPDDLQRIVLETANSHMQNDEFPWYINFDKENIAYGKSKGMELITLSADDQKKFADSIAPVWDKWLQQCKDQGIGEQAQKLKKIIDKHWKEWAATHK